MYIGGVRLSVIFIVKVKSSDLRIAIWEHSHNWSTSFIHMHVSPRKRKFWRELKNIASSRNECERVLFFLLVHIQYIQYILIIYVIKWCVETIGLCVYVCEWSDVCDAQGCAFFSYFPKMADGKHVRTKAGRICCTTQRVRQFGESQLFRRHLVGICIFVLTACIHTRVWYNYINCNPAYM